MQPVGDDFFWGVAGAEFAFNKFVVIELVLIQPEIGRVVFIPAGEFICTAFGAGTGVGMDVGAAVGAGIRWFGRHQPMPAYSSSVFRSIPINT